MPYLPYDLDDLDGLMAIENQPRCKPIGKGLMRHPQFSPAEKECTTDMTCFRSPEAVADLSEGKWKSLITSWTPDPSTRSSPTSSWIYEAEAFPAGEVITSEKRVAQGTVVVLLATIELSSG